ncbi:MAG: universal stress protein [Marinilabiliaceae bacterium]
MGAVKNFSNMLVSLDLTDIDVQMIGYAYFLSQKLDIDKVYFVHAIQAYDLGRDGRKHSEVRNSLSDSIRKKINETVSERFRESTQTEVITRIEDEDAARGVLEVIQNEDIDVTLLGQKYGQNREGRYAREISTKADSDLLLVPEDPSMKLDHIVCAVDFSGDSETAFREALDMSRLTGAKLSCYYIYDIRKMYFPAATDQDLASLEKQFEKKCDKFLARFGLQSSDVDRLFNVNDKLTGQAEKLYNKAVDVGADLIIVGARGQTDSVISLLGNITENLMRMETEVPVMIIKNKKSKGWSLF